MTNHGKTFDRTTAGLRDALMSEMEDIRAGIATPDEAHAFAELAARVIGSLEADLMEQRRRDAIEEREKEREERAKRREHRLQMELVRRGASVGVLEYVRT
jgi:hypothetical protein